MITLNVNGRSIEVDVDPQTPLLWVLRDTVGLTRSRCCLPVRILRRRPKVGTNFGDAAFFHRSGERWARLLACIFL